MTGEKGVKLSILSVPVEVLQAVGVWLKPEEREQARLACRHLHDSFTSELLTLLVRPQSVADVSLHYVEEFFRRFPHSTKAMLYLTGHWAEGNYPVLAQHMPLIPNRVKKLTVLAGAGFQHADPTQLNSKLLDPLASLKQLEELEIVSVQADTRFLSHLTRLTYLVLAPCTPAPDYFWVSLFVKSQVPQVFSAIPSSAQHWHSLLSLQQLSIELPLPPPAGPQSSNPAVPTAHDVIQLLQPLRRMEKLQKFLLGLSSSVLQPSGIQMEEPAKVVSWLLDTLPSLQYVKLRNLQYEQEKMHLEMQDPEEVQDVATLWGALSWQRQRMVSPSSSSHRQDSCLASSQATTTTSLTCHICPLRAPTFTSEPSATTSSTAAQPNPPPPAASSASVTHHGTLIAQQGAVELSLWVPPYMLLSDALSQALQLFSLDQVVKLELVHFKSRTADLKTLTRLNRLTCLYLNGAYSTAGLVRQLSSLKSLQELQLDGYVDDCWRVTHNITTTVSLRPQSAALLARSLPALKFLGCEGRISKGALHPLVDLNHLQGLSVMDLPCSPCCSIKRSTPTLHSLPTALTCIDLFDVRLVSPAGEIADAERLVGRKERGKKKHGRGAEGPACPGSGQGTTGHARVAALPNLCMLKLTRCTVDSFAMLASCSRLQCVLVADCQAAAGAAEVPVLAAHWPCLRRLECVEDSQPHPPCPLSSHLPRHRFFDVWAQDSSLQGLSVLQSLKHFAAIQVNGNIMSGISDVGVATLAGLTALRSLSLEIGEAATEQCLSFLANMTWLRTLELRVPEYMDYSSALTQLRSNLSQAEVAVSNHLFVSIC